MRIEYDQGAASFSAEQNPLLKTKAKFDLKTQFLSFQMKKTAENSAVQTVEKAVRPQGEHKKTAIMIIST